MKPHAEGDVVNATGIRMGGVEVVHHHWNTQLHFECLRTQIVDASHAKSIVE